MKSKWLLIATGSLYLASGVIALLAPERQLALYGVISGPAQNHMAQWAGLGSVMIGLFAISAGKAKSLEPKRQAMGILIVYFLISGSISAYGTLGGVMASVPGWILCSEGFAMAGVFALYLRASACSIDRGNREPS